MNEPAEDRPAGLSNENPPLADEAAETLLGDEEPDLIELDTVELEVLDRPGPASAADLGLELPDEPEQAQQVLLRELAEARAEAGEYLETLQRVAADFDNYRKRVERDHAENVLRASQRVIEQILPTLDNLDAALGYEPQTPAEEKILDGMRGTQALLLETLGRDGLAPIPAAGTPFDPAVHEAVAGPGDGDGELVVADELRRGYTLHGRVLRPSLVTVSHRGD
ncbi:MAG TPA: nucleotide exchange factor GrpE [Acidimicrobiia bacterium]|jgi:molecular chaperone GrpE